MTRPRTSRVALSAALVAGACAAAFAGVLSPATAGPTRGGPRAGSLTRELPDTTSARARARDLARGGASNEADPAARAQDPHLAAPARSPAAAASDDALVRLLEALEDGAPAPAGAAAALAAAAADDALGLPLRAGALRAWLALAGREALPPLADLYASPGAAALRPFVAEAFAWGAGPEDGAALARLVAGAEATGDPTARALAASAAAAAVTRPGDEGPVRLAPGDLVRLEDALARLARHAPPPRDDEPPTPDDVPGNGSAHEAATGPDEGDPGPLALAPGEVRQVALEALAGLATPGALATLREIARGAADPEDRLVAALALGPGEVEAAAALSALAGLPQADAVGDAARRALGQAAAGPHHQPRGR